MDQSLLAPMMNIHVSMTGFQFILYPGDDYLQNLISSEAIARLHLRFWGAYFAQENLAGNRL